VHSFGAFDEDGAPVAAARTHRAVGGGRLTTRDGVLLVASLDDLMATKLTATLDRAEAKDYRDIAAMISAGTRAGALPPLTFSRERRIIWRNGPDQVPRREKS
jgi:hypothetical protein